MSKPFYATEDDLSKIETTFDGDTVWLSIDQMAVSFQRDKSTISKHIKNINLEEELVQEAKAIRTIYIKGSYKYRR